MDKELSLEELKRKYLTDKKILIKFVVKAQFKDKPKGHLLWGGKLDNTKDVLCVAANPSNGSLKDPFTAEERLFVSKATGIDSKYFDPFYRGSDGFWNDYEVLLTKDGSILDMSDLNDFIKYKVLLTNDKLIAPTYDSFSKNPKASYKYYMVDEKAEVKTKARSLNSKVTAYKALDKIRKDRAKMHYLVLELTKLTPGRATSIETLEAQLEIAMETKLDKFVDLVQDKLFDTKVFLEKAVMEGVLVKRGGEFYHDNKPLAAEGMKANITNAATYISDPQHQDIFLVIEDRLNNARE